MLLLLCLTSSSLEIHILASGKLQQLHLQIILLLNQPPINEMVFCTFGGLEKSLVPHLLSSLRGPCYDKHA